MFPGWTLYIEYATQKIAETFPSSEEEKRQLFHFRDTLKQLLLGTQRQAREKLTMLYKAVAESTYGVEGGETVCARRDVDVCRDSHATWRRS